MSKSKQTPAQTHLPKKKHCNTQKKKKKIVDNTNTQRDTIVRKKHQRPCYCRCYIPFLVPVAGLRFTTLSIITSTPISLMVLTRFCHHSLSIHRHCRFTAVSHSSQHDPIHQDNYLSRWKFTTTLHHFLEANLSLSLHHTDPKFQFHPRFILANHTYGVSTAPSPGNTRRSHYTPRLRCRVCAPSVKRYGNTPTNWRAGNPSQLHSHLDSIKFRRQHYYLSLSLPPSFIF